MKKIDWPLTIGLNFFRGLFVGIWFQVITGGGEVTMTDNWLANLLFVAILIPPLMHISYSLILRLADFFGVYGLFGLVLRLVTIVAYGLPFMIADVIIWLALRLVGSSVSFKPKLQAIAYIIVYKLAAGMDLGFYLPRSWRDSR